MNAEAAASSSGKKREKRKRHSVESAKLIAPKLRKLILVKPPNPALSGGSKTSITSSRKRVPPKSMPTQRVAKAPRELGKEESMPQRKQARIGPAVYTAGFCTTMKRLGPSNGTIGTHKIESVARIITVALPTKTRPFGSG